MSSSSAAPDGMMQNPLLAARSKLSTQHVAADETDEERSTMLVSPALAHENVHRTHPRVRGTEREVSLREPVYVRQRDGKLLKEQRDMVYVRLNKFRTCRVHTGRFCPDTCLCNTLCNCCCENQSSSELGDFGSTITSYFKQIKMLIVMFIISGLFAVPSLVLNNMGSGVLEPGEGAAGPFPQLFATTAGNLNDNPNITSIALPRPVCDSFVQILGGWLPPADTPREALTSSQLAWIGYRDCEMPKAHVVLVEAACDFVSMLIFLLGWVVMTHYMNKEAEDVDLQSVEVTDYAVFLPSIPRWLTEKRIREHFARVLIDSKSGSPYPIARVNIIDDGFKRLGLFVKKGHVDKALEKCESARKQLELEQEVLGKGGWCCGTCATRASAIEALEKQATKLRAKELELRNQIRRFAAAGSPLAIAKLELEDLEKQAAKRAGGASKECALTCWSLTSQIRAKQAEIAGLEKEAEEDAASGEAADSIKSVAAFVVFETEEGCNECKDAYPSNCMQRGCCQSTGMRVRHPDDGKKGKAVAPWPLRVDDAPDPSTVLWENLDVTPTQQQARQCTTGLLALLLLLASFVALYVASIAKAQLAADAEVGDCFQLAKAINATRTNGTELEYRTSYGQFDPTAQPIWPSVESWLRTEGYTPTTHPLLRASNRNATMQNCYCKAIRFTALQSDQLVSHEDREVCAGYYCPSLALVSFDKITSTDFCLDWLGKYTTTFGLSVIASVAVVLVNMMLTTVIWGLSNFDAYYSEDELQASLAWKMFAAQFFNTALLTLLVNAYIPGISSESSRDRLYDDMSRSWFANVGSSLLLTMAIQIATPHINIIVARILIIMARKNKIASSQVQLNDSYLGPQMMLPLRYSQMFTFIFVALMYSSGMPILLWFASIAMIVFYWVELFGFLNVFRTPARTNGLLSRVMVRLLPLAVFLHCGFAVWIYGNTNIFTTDQELQESLDRERAAALQFLGPQDDTNFSTKVITRAGASAAVPFFVGMILLIALAVLRIVFMLFTGFIMTLIKLITCGYGCPCCIRERELDGVPPYSEAIEYAQTLRDKPELTTAEREELKPKAMNGTPDYNLFRDQRLQRLFNLPPTFADSYSRLTDLQYWTPEAAEEAKEKERKQSLARSRQSLAGRDKAAIAAAFGGTDRESRITSASASAEEEVVTSPLMAAAAAAAARAPQA